MSFVAVVAAAMMLEERVDCPEARLDHSFVQLVVHGAGSSAAGSIVVQDTFGAEQEPSAPVVVGSVVVVRHTENYQ